jgi:hypothetical protein
MNRSGKWYQLIVIFTIFELGGCASFSTSYQKCASFSTSDQKPAEAGQCTVIHQNDINKFDGTRSQLIGKRYAFYSKAKKDLQPLGPYLLGDIKYCQRNSNGTWWGIQFNDNEIDVAETFIETSTGKFENVILLQGQVAASISCPLESIVYQKKILLN